MEDYNSSQIAKNVNKPLYRGQRLHSRYNPQREADTILEKQIGNSQPQAIIIIEPGEGYIIASARKRYPQTPLLALHIDNRLYQRCRWPADAVWYPGLSRSLETVCSSFIAASPLPRIAIIIPPVMLQLAPTEVAAYREKLRGLLTQIRSDIATVGTFGRCWLVNSLINFLSIAHITRIPPITKPLCIVGSGSSIDEQLGILNKLQKKLTIWALPSALPSLLKENIIPQLVVATDGGYWATWHYRPLRTISNSPGIPWALPLTAARGIYHYQHPVFLFQQGFALERRLAHFLVPRSPALPSSGTVAGSALLLAAHLGARQVILAGIDLAFRNWHLHCQHHSFHHYYQQHLHRTYPVGMIELLKWMAATASDSPSMRIERRHAIYRTMLEGIISTFQKKISVGVLAPSAFGEHIPTYRRREIEHIIAHSTAASSTSNSPSSLPSLPSLTLSNRSTRQTFLKQLGNRISNELRQSVGFATMRSELREILLALNMPMLYRLAHPSNAHFANQWRQLCSHTAEKFDYCIQRHLC